jgi:hypothetical protein
MEDSLHVSKSKNKENSVKGDKVLKKENVRRRKKDRMDNIFQSFADILYFFEFIEKHYQDVGEIFEEDLKDLYGYNDLPLKKGGKKINTQESIKEDKKHKRGIIGGPLMRLVRSTLLLNRTDKIEALDFRTVALSNVFIKQSTSAILRRVDDFDELALITQDTQRAVTWARYLAKQVDDSHNVPHRIIEKFYDRA